MSCDIGKWLDGLGLGRYAAAFVDNEIDLHALPHITDEDLKEIGVALGARRKLLAAIAGLGNVVEPAAADEKSDVRSAGVEAERRQLTVMFVDLVDSTALSERLDPEDLREVIRAYQGACAEPIGRYEGHIAKYIGDGLLVYFGYPQAHEDDARRAVMAGLGIIAGLETLNRRLGASHGVELSVRIGIHTGLVVVGEMGGNGTPEADAIVGRTPNVAARLEALAEPNTVAISAATQRLVEGLFECDDLGPQKLKGVSKPVRVFRALGESAAPSRFEATAERGLTPLVGRGEEVDLLSKRWEQARNGESQVVLLSGEAGVGKSRIVRAVRERLEGEPHSRILYYCSPYHRNSALFPAIDQFERALRFVRDDGPTQKLDKLEAVLGDIGLAVAETAPLFASLLSIPADSRHPPLELAPEQLKARTLEAIVSVFQAMAAQAPVLIVVEDAHWIDPSSVELLSLAIARLSAARVLMIITYRPEFEPPWASESHFSSLTLNRLGRGDAAEMVANVTGGKALPDEVLDQIIARTDGVPLYVEELTKTVLESGVLKEDGDDYVLTGPLPPFAIPASLQDSLMARLDRLAPVKEVAQIAAVLGRNFGHELLAAVAPLVGAALDNALGQLVESEIIYRRGLAPDITYEFKHALVQDAAYQSLLKSTRQRYHKRIAETLEKRFSETAATQPELLAHHFTEAGLVEQAIPNWLRATQRATARSANLEALGHISRGLSLVAKMPASQIRDHLELELQVASTTPIIGAKGWGTSHLEEATRRATDLCQTVRDTSLVSRALYMQWGYWTWNGRHRISYDASRQLLDIAEKEDNEVGLLMGWGLLGRVQCYMGDIQAGRGHIERSLDLYDAAKHSGLALQFGQDPAVAGHIGLSWCLWVSGFSEQALAARDHALRSAEEAGHPQTLCYALAMAAMMHGILALEEQELETVVERLWAIIEERGFWHMAGQASCARGWVQAQRGDTEAALVGMREGLDSMESAGCRLMYPFILALMASLYGRRAEVREGLKVVRLGLKTVEETSEKWIEPELHRIEGLLLAQDARGDPNEAEESLKRAVEIAQHQGAGMFKLRAVTSLARLWGENRKRDEARELLAPIYGWFTEGFDTPDLKDAKALLDELS